MHAYMNLVTDRHGVGRDIGLDWICIARMRTRTRTRGIARTEEKGREGRGGEVCGRRPLQGTSSGCAACAAVYAGLLPPRELCSRRPPSAARRGPEEVLSSVFGVWLESAAQVGGGT